VLRFDGGVDAATAASTLRRRPRHPDSGLEWKHFFTLTPFLMFCLDLDSSLDTLQPRPLQRALISRMRSTAASNTNPTNSRIGGKQASISLHIIKLTSNGLPGNQTLQFVHLKVLDYHKLDTSSHKTPPHTRHFLTPQFYQLTPYLPHTPQRTLASTAPLTVRARLLLPSWLLLRGLLHGLPAWLRPNAEYGLSAG
jgi:hypothetical protein